MQIRATALEVGLKGDADVLPAGILEKVDQDGTSTPLVLPPAYGLAQVKNETYTAEGLSGPEELLPIVNALCETDLRERTTDERA